MYNFQLLKELIERVPDGANIGREIRKETLNKKTRDKIVERDERTCQLCGYVDEKITEYHYSDRYGSLKSTLSEEFAKKHSLIGDFRKHEYYPGLVQVHHIIPWGDSSDSNLITLCFHCHNAVHLILCRAGKWRHVPVNKSPRY
ncbi:MAG: HNH endonuclease [Candidatus Helarchaeota archaeon]|nr:HNH endonuclease [Candidatus Helarchaeota archaeon]